MNNKKFVVRYRLKADRVEENQRRIRAVFGELQDRKLPGIRYAVYRQSDGVSFVHILSSETEADHKAFTSLPAFREFQDQPKDRFEELPLAGEAETIGEY